jgi:hypothetical protein
MCSEVGGMGERNDSGLLQGRYHMGIRLGRPRKTRKYLSQNRWFADRDLDLVFNRIRILSLLKSQRLWSLYATQCVTETLLLK